MTSVGPYTTLDPEAFQRKMRWVKCESCNTVYKTDLPGPMCPKCDCYCITLLKRLLDE